jgi:hypothetical protein
MSGALGIMLRSCSSSKQVLSDTPSFVAVMEEVYCMFVQRAMSWDGIDLLVRDRWHSLHFAAHGIRLFWVPSSGMCSWFVARFRLHVAGVSEGYGLEVLHIQAGNYRTAFYSDT